MRYRVTGSDRRNGAGIETMRTFRVSGSGLILLATSICGCFQAPKVTDKQLDRGCVIMLPGIEGNAWQLEGTYNGLRDAGVEQAIEIIPWGSPPLSSLPNLIDIEENRRRADRIAAKIASYRKARPDAPITLVGFSGGGGLAILTLEALDEGVQVDRAILIAAAISNHYDVNRVLPRCRHEMINIYSRLDTVVSTGTTVFGTIDRENSISAGHSGFVDATGAMIERSKLRQIGWTPAWITLGHHGGHIGCLARPWAHDVLAPLVAQ
jgi:pimeloyl-ACP methyl ester carboxylesterase